MRLLPVQFLDSRDICYNGLNMTEKDTIKFFVQKTLGCGCPEEVFSHIEYQTAIPLENHLLAGKINIGNRLLVYIAEINKEEELSGLLPFLVKQGMAERERLQFNRFRIVIAAEGNGNVEQYANTVFRNVEKDEKVHLHIIRKSEIPFL
jgi:hypothetical protein